MKRRQFITLLGGAAAAWPLAARAQRQAMPVIGFLNAASAAGYATYVAAFRDGLKDNGFIEDRNVAIEYRFAEDQYDRLPALAADLIARRVTVIAAGPRAVDAAKALTATIPIVFLAGSDPVRNGLVASLNRPGGNLTGVSILAGDINAKRFRLLHDLVPQAGVIGVLWDTTNPTAEFALREVQAAANSVGTQIEVVGAGTDAGIDAAFASFTRKGAGAVFVNNGFFFFGRRELLAMLATRYQMPLSGELRGFVEAGALTSYGPNDVDAFRQVGTYVGRILNGEKPADLPVLQPTKFEFMINLKTAKVIGLQVPPNVLAIADEVIE
jgi:putative ABC transport system substrate-binding protein